MDTWNPWIAETHVKRLRWWEIALGAVIGWIAVIGGVWALAAIVLQIDQIIPWITR